MTQITINGKSLTTIGQLPETGSKAPGFQLTNQGLMDVSLQDYNGKPLLLNIFPSIDTPTCAKSVRRFNLEAATMPDIDILCISMDLPFAQKRFCGIEGIDNVRALSNFRNRSFGRDYGVEILDGPMGGLLARAIVIINAAHEVVYTELVQEMAYEPDYRLALEAVSQL